MNALSPCRPASILGHLSPDLLICDPSPFGCMPSSVHGCACPLHAPALIYTWPAPLAMFHAPLHMPAPWSTMCLSPQESPGLHPWLHIPTHAHVLICTHPHLCP